VFFHFSFIALTDIPVDVVGSFQTVQTIFYLPIELVTLVAKHLCNADLYALTRVSHHMASIACPLYLARVGLIPSQRSNNLCLSRDGFKALGICLRSPGFSPSDQLSCTFSFSPQRATMEIASLRKFLASLPPHPRPFFRRVHLVHVDVGSLRNLLAFVQYIVLLTGCSDLVLSDVAYEKLRGRGMGVAGKETRTPPITVLPSLQRLKLTHFDASPLQWAAFFSGVYFPSLHSLDVSGASSICAIFDFLDQHPTVCVLRFLKSSWKDIPSSSRQLELPLLHALQGSPHQILFLLRVITPPPVLSSLVIEACPPTQVRCDPLVDQVMDILTMCRGPLSFQIVLTKKACMAEPTFTDAHKLRFSSLAFVSSLHILFLGMREIIPVGTFLFLFMTPRPYG